jgi:hypothetical protein
MGNVKETVRSGCLSKEAWRGFPPAGDGKERI